MMAKLQFLLTFILCLVVLKLSQGNTQEKSGSRRKILLKFYDGGMKSLREKKLIDKAVKLAGCSKLQVKNFIYNENKKRKMTTDVKFLNKTVTRNKFQAFQSKLARDVKIYGSKYNNKSASELWDSISKNHKPEVVQKTVKAHKVVESNERKLEALITEISKVNVNVMYARKSGKSTFCICSPLVKDMMEKFVTHVDKIFGTDWEKLAQDKLAEAEALRPNLNVAKNVILFVGDGLGLSTITAARIYKGQLNGNPGEETILAFENFPNVALSKTYGSDTQVADSAQTSTAMHAGVKGNWETVGVDDTVKSGDCIAVKGHEVNSILHYSKMEGKSIGVVTTARVTHATPAGAYAHSANRYWESDVDMVGVDGNCSDTAWQLIYDNDIDVVLGGGRRSFLPKGMDDPELTSPSSKQRNDRLNLIEVWEEKQSSLGRRYKYVWNNTDFNNIDPMTTDTVLGLFESGHMEYEAQRNKGPNGEPSIAEMTAKAIQILQKNPKGFFLTVEGGRIDHAHHDSLAKLALIETVELDEAVKEAARLTKESDTLIIVTADHSHVFNIGGYPSRGNNILGLVDPWGFNEEPEKNGLPYTTLTYGNGPGYKNGKRPNLTQVDTTANNYVQESPVPLNLETHGGEDVGIYSRGPLSHLLHGVQEQHYIAHVMMYASCVGKNKKHCQKPPTTLPPCIGASDRIVSNAFYLSISLVFYVAL